MAADRNIFGVVLAAGKSARLGRPKQTLMLNGRSILEHVIETASASRLRGTAVVLGAAAEDILAMMKQDIPRVRFVSNTAYHTGQASSLAVGLRALGKNVEAAAVLLGDQPGVTVELVDRMIEAFSRSDLPFARPTFANGRGSRVPGHPVILARSVWPAALLLTGDEGARQLIRTRPRSVLEVPIEGPSPIDIDTEEDYERLLASSA